MGLYLSKPETQKISTTGKVHDFNYASTSV